MSNQPTPPRAAGDDPQAAAHQFEPQGSHQVCRSCGLIQHRGNETTPCPGPQLLAGRWQLGQSDPPTPEPGPEARPTPGPWKVIPPGHGHPTEYLCVQLGEDEMYTTLEMRPADAHLIAAAPDLLGACQALMAWLDIDTDPWVEQEMVDHAKPLARAAITKAGAESTEPAPAFEAFARRRQRLHAAGELALAACIQAPAGEPAPLDQLETAQAVLATYGPFKTWEACARLLADLRAACAKAEGSPQ